MPFWILKFLPVRHWKGMLAVLVFFGYTFIIIQHTNTKWKLRLAKQEQIAKDRAAEVARTFNKEQARIQEEREARFLEETRQAEQRALAAREQAAEQRRLNNVTTRQLEALQIDAPRPLSDGVRNILVGRQDTIRSRRHP